MTGPKAFKPFKVGSVRVGSTATSASSASTPTNANPLCIGNHAGGGYTYSPLSDCQGVNV